MFCLLNSLSKRLSNKLRLQLREFSIYFFIPPRLVQIYEIYIFITVNPLLMNQYRRSLGSNSDKPEFFRHSIKTEGGYMCEILSKRV